jgi:hypothetical protein
MGILEVAGHGGAVSGHGAWALRKWPTQFQQIHENDLRQEKGWVQININVIYFVNVN